MTAPPSCLVCGRPSASWAVCPSCQDRIDDHLAEIADLYALLDACRDEFLMPANEADTGTNGRGRRIDPPPPGDLEVMALLDRRTGVVAMLAAWASDVRETYGLVQPAKPEPLVELVRVLRAQLPRIVESHPAVDDFAREVRTTLRDLDAAVRGPLDRRVKLGGCPVVLPATDTAPAHACGHTLYANPISPVIHCRGCGSRWPRDEWDWLAAMIAVDDTRAG